MNTLFYFSKTSEETIITLFVKRKNPNVHIEEFTITFFDFEGCKKHVEELDRSTTLALRYFDQIYTGYTKVDLDSELPVSRISIGETIKILIQTFRVKEKKKKSFKIETISINSDILSAYENKERALHLITMGIPPKKRKLALQKKFVSKKGLGLKDLLEVTKTLDSILILLSVKPLDEMEKEDIDFRKTLEDIKEPQDIILGIYTGDNIEPSTEYDGTTDTTVFSISPLEKYFQWTKKNNYFFLATDEGLSIGGNTEKDSEDISAIFIDENLEYGESHSCSTFDNSPLCGTFIHFKIINIEVFTFQ